MCDTKFSVTNYNGITVSCTKNRWDTHIVPHHGIMAKNVDAVKDTIKNPEYVYESKNYEDTEVYFKASSKSSYKIYTKVVVNYSYGKHNPDSKVGNVVTAFPQKEIKGGIGDVVYEKATDQL